MTKKYLCGVVSAAVLMGACPTAVFAADSLHVAHSVATTSDSAPRALYKCGRRLGLGCSQPNADR